MSGGIFEINLFKILYLIGVVHLLIWVIKSPDIMNDRIANMD